jgi:protein-tyrosine kinase
MSRIHDALKMAATSKELLQQDASDPHRSESTRLLEVPPSIEEELPSINAETTIAVPIRPNGILEGSRRLGWNLDSRVALPFHNMEPQKACEEFRALRTRLHQIREKRPLKALLVTSAVPQEGRSFVSLNLAHVLALQTESRVLLIDADLRGRSLHSCFDTTATPGLAEYLLQENEEFEIMQRGDAPNLFLIPAGRPVAGPTELVANGRFRSLVSTLGELFDWIVIDSPPATPVSDACSLSNYCDGVVMVVRAKSTPFDAVRKGLERFPEESLVGVVLNQVAGQSR